MSRVFASRGSVGVPGLRVPGLRAYIATDEGWLYLAAVIDLFSRQVVGWSMRPHMQTSLVTDALRMAWFRRHPAPGLIFHSDRGSQYCSHAFQDALSSYGMRSSMSRKGNCWDNAPTESLWGSLNESGPAVWQEVRHPTPSDGWGDRLADVLQPSQTSLHAGLYQPNEVRSKLARGPVKECRVTEWLWTTLNEGKVSVPLACWLPISSATRHGYFLIWKGPAASLRGP